MTWGVLSIQGCGQPDHGINTSTNILSTNVTYGKISCRP